MNCIIRRQHCAVSFGIVLLAWIGAALCLAGNAWTAPTANGEYIRDWLTLGPIPVKDADANKNTFPLDLDALRPAENSAETLPSGARLSWTPYHSGSIVLDLADLMGARVGVSLLLSTEFHAAQAGEVQMLLTAEAPVMVVINDRVIAARAVPQAFRLDSTFAKVPVNAGENRLTVLVTRRHAGACRLALRLLDPASPGPGALLRSELLDSTAFGGVFLHPSAIRMKTGDERAWRTPDFPDADWEVTDTFHAPAGLEKGGTVWFRFPLRAAPDLVGRGVLFEAFPHVSTLEIYLDGVRIPGPELMRRPWREVPAPFYLQHADSMIALRWQVTPAVLAYETSDFTLLLRDYPKTMSAFRLGWVAERNYATHRIILMAVFAATLLFHATLSIYRPRRKENLFAWLTLLACFGAVVTLHISEVTPDQRTWFICYYRLFLGFMVFSVVAGLGLLRFKLSGRFSRSLYVYALLGLAAYLATFRFGNLPAHAFPLLLLPEVTRIFWEAHRQKRFKTWFLFGFAASLILLVIGDAAVSIAAWPANNGLLRYLPWYLLAVFIQVMLVLLARKFAEAMKKIERFAASLEEQVAQRTRELDAEIAVRSKAERDLTKSLALLRATIESTIDGLLVVDHDGRLVVCNQRMADLWGLEHGWFDSTPAETRIAGLAQQAQDPEAAAALARLFEEGDSWQVDTIMLKNGQILECCASPYRVNNEIAGRLLVVEDETDRYRHDQTRERLVDDLQEALSRVKTLSGLLPICASCKKIRDDSGYWRQIEVYISTHTEAEFSHGICPDCMRQIYPDYDESGDRHETKP
jgi:PAS domain-containing protein